MEFDHIKKVLSELGLTEREQTVYLALLQVGVSSASVLGQRTDIAKSTTQYTCQQLAKKGLITKLEKNKTYMYRTEDPQRLLLLLERQRSEIRKQEEHVQQIIGPLKELMQPALAAPRIRIYEGLEQVKDGFWTMLDSLTEKDEILSYAHALDRADMQHANLFELLMRFSDERVRRKIYYRLIAADNREGRAVQRDATKYFSEVRLAPAELFACAPTEIIIYRDTVWNLSIEQGYYFAYTAEHHSLTTLQRDAFEMVWKQLR